MLETKDLEMIAEIMTRVVGPIQKEVETLQGKVTGLQGNMETLQENMATLQKDVSTLQENVGTLRENVETLQRDVVGIKVTLENEVKTGINIIGEGHIDLNRKLDQVLESKEERELMKLRILSLESEVRRIKEKLEIA